MGEVDKPPTEGRQVTLTIDERIQHVTEMALGEAIRNTGSISGVAVVIDPRTGEVLGHVQPALLQSESLRGVSPSGTG